MRGVKSHRRRRQTCRHWTHGEHEEELIAKIRFGQTDGGQQRESDRGKKLSHPGARRNLRQGVAEAGLKQASRFISYHQDQNSTRTKLINRRKTNS